MKKLSRREKTIVRLMILTVGVWLFLEVWESYQAHKVNIQSDIDSMQSEMAAFSRSLEGESTDKYTNQIATIEGDLDSARDRVLELPREADASLLIRSTLDRKAESSGLNINSISSRRSKPVTPDSELYMLPTYIGYDTDLASLLDFFGSFDQQGYFLAIDTVNLSARAPLRRPRRRGGARPEQQRSPLTGNAVLLTLFRADENGSVDNYQERGGEPRGAENTVEPPVNSDALADNDDNDNQAPERKPVTGDRNGDGIPDNPRDRVPVVPELPDTEPSDQVVEDNKKPKPRGNGLPDRIKPTKPERSESTRPSNVVRKPINRPTNSGNPNNSGSNNNAGQGNSSGNSLVPIPDNSGGESTKPKPDDLARPPKPLTGTASIKKNKTGDR